MSESEKVTSKHMSGDFNVSFIKRIIRTERVTYAAAFKSQIKCVSLHVWYILIFIHFNIFYKLIIGNIVIKIY